MKVNASSWLHSDIIQLLIVNSHPVDKNKFQSSGSINPVRRITFI